MDELTIDPQFAGPPGWGNGGYVCGRLGQMLGGTVVVTLRRPIPLGRPLSVVRPAPDVLELRDGDAPLAEARAGALQLALPEPPRFAEAEAARARSPALGPERPLASCFVCGSDRGEGDGLRLFPGPIGAAGVLAAPWAPEPVFADGEGIVRPEFVWAALDCTGAFAVLQERAGANLLLGRLTARLDRRVEAGRRYVVAGWRIASDGRKHEAGTAVFAEDGRACAAARATWIEPRAA